MKIRGRRRRKSIPRNPSSLVLQRDESMTRAQDDPCLARYVRRTADAVRKHDSRRPQRKPGRAIKSLPAGVASRSWSSRCRRHKPSVQLLPVRALGEIVLTGDKRAGLIRLARSKRTCARRDVRASSCWRHRACGIQVIAATLDVGHAQVACRARQLRGSVSRQLRARPPCRTFRAASKSPAPRFPGEAQGFR
jgi:hypothetical protein